MPHEKGEPRTPGSGRKKGTPNKLTASQRSILQEAFEDLGGVLALVEWAEANRTEFYKLWGRTIPQKLEHTGTEGAPIMVITNVPQPESEASGDGA